MLSVTLLRNLADFAKSNSVAKDPSTRMHLLSHSLVSLPAMSDSTYIRTARFSKFICDPISPSVSLRIAI